MSEFKLHHLIVQLVEVLNLESAPERHLEKLQKESSTANALNTVAPHSCIQYLAKISPQPELRIDLLSPFVQTLDLIYQDEELMKYLFGKSTLELKTSALRDPTITQQSLVNINDGVLLKHNWVTERPRITWDFYSDVVPVVSEKFILLLDILYCLKGINGSYIVSEPLTNLYGVKTFNIVSDVGISFKHLAQQILPLASYYSMTVRFVEEKISPNDGLVNHALRGAI